MRTQFKRTENKINIPTKEIFKKKIAHRTPYHSIISPLPLFRELFTISPCLNTLPETKVGVYLNDYFHLYFIIFLDFFFLQTNDQLGLKISSVRKLYKLYFQ